MESSLDKAKALQDRTKQFALRVIRLFKSLPHSAEAQVMGKQLLRSATSVAANYRAACRGRTSAEFISKLGVVVEEADESVLWLELLVDSQTVPSQKMDDLLKEARELVAIFTTSRKTARDGRS